MNIFFLSECPREAATMMCDKHVVKMILETCQLLSTAHNVLDGEGSGPYKTTHVNHPCAVCARETMANYRWLHDHLLALLDEYNYRYGRYHACNPISVLLDECPDNITLTTTLTLPPLCMPDGCKVGRNNLQAQALTIAEAISSEVVLSYRNYYARDKAHLLKYTRRLAPLWIEDHGA